MPAVTVTNGSRRVPGSFELLAAKAASTGRAALKVGHGFLLHHSCAGIRLDFNEVLPESEAASDSYLPPCVPFFKRWNGSAR